MKKYVRMNDNDNELSFGNLCRLVKEVSLNKKCSNQVDLFCLIFNDTDVGDSTINNYCVGCRSIGDKYKKLVSLYRKKYNSNRLFMIDIVNGLIMLLSGNFDSNLTVDEINENSLLEKLCFSLYNIAKNDGSVNNNFICDIKNYLDNGLLYDCIVNFIFYVVLEKKQPIYVENVINDTISDILNNTDISLNDLKKFLALNFRDGVNYIYELKRLVKENNAYACFEYGYMEYKGEIVGFPRYNSAYTYFDIAASYKHPRANLLIASMLLKGQIGTKSDDDIKKAIRYLETAISLGSVAALNKMGLFYLDKDKDKAISYFNKAISFDYVYAYNNLGKIYELEGDYETAFNYYIKSALKEESWALNKIGEFYRLGLYVNRDIKKAYEYYNLSCDVPVYLLEYYSKYNLAKYFYLNGNYELGIEKDIDKAISLFEDASLHGNIDASIELFKLFDTDKSKRELYRNRIINNSKYNSYYSDIIGE